MVNFDKIDPSKNIENDPEKKLLSQFKDSLSYLAAEVKNTSRTAFDKALQSLEKWLYSQEKSVQKEVVKDLNTLRSSVVISKNRENKGSGSQERFPHDPLYRSSSVDKEILSASHSISRMIEESDQNPNPISSVVGGWMKKIMQTEK